MIAATNVVGLYTPSPIADRLGGLVVKAFASGADDPGLESRLRRFPWSSCTSDLKIGTPAVTVPDAI